MWFQNVILSITAIFVGPPHIKLGEVSWERITLGNPIDIYWSGADGPVTIRLLTNSLTEATVIAANLVNTTSYRWVPPISLADGHFTVQIRDCTTQDYSPRFWMEKSSPYWRRQYSSSSAGGDYLPTSSDYGVGPSTTTDEIPSSTISSDIASITTDSSSTFSTPATITTSSGTVPSNTVVPSSDTGLSTGAKAGIGVGAGIFVLLLVAAGFFLFRLGRRSATKKAAMTQTMPSAEPGAWQPPMELHGRALTGKEMEDIEMRRRVAELQGVIAMPAELGPGERAELDGRRWGP